MNKICLIQQEAGIGDVFFCQNIAKKYIEEGYRVVWPLSPFVYETIPKYLPIGEIEYYDKTQDFPKKEKFNELYNLKKLIKTEEFAFIPIGWSQHVAEVKYERTMTAKYAMCGLNYKNWKKNLFIKRNYQKEEELLSTLKIKNEEYCLVNTTFSTPPNTLYKNVSYAFEHLDISNMKKIEMKIIPGYSIFDWCGVLEKASFVVTVDTCFMYFMEFLNLKSSKNFCFPRSGMYTYNEINDLFEVKWNYCL